MMAGAQNVENLGRHLQNTNWDGSRANLKSANT